MKNISRSLAAVGIVLFSLTGANAQSQSYGTIGSTYSQNFNSLTTNGATVTNSAGGVIFAFNDPAGINATNMPGWYGEAALKTVYLANSGNTTTGAFYSYATNGASSASDQALGLETTTTSGQEIFGVAFSNTTGVTLTNFTISYNAEYWHDGTATTSKTLAFGYVVGGGATLPTISTNGTITPASGSYIHDSTLDYTQTGPGVARTLDGHAAANSTTESDTLSVSWTPNTTLWLVWDFGTNTAQTPGLAIDNVTFSAVPEPTTYLLLGVGGLALLIGYRHRRA